MCVNTVTHSSSNFLYSVRPSATVLLVLLLLMARQPKGVAQNAQKLIVPRTTTTTMMMTTVPATRRKSRCESAWTLSSRLLSSSLFLFFLFCLSLLSVLSFIWLSSFFVSFFSHVSIFSSSSPSLLPPLLILLGSPLGIVLISNATPFRRAFSPAPCLTRRLLTSGGELASTSRETMHHSHWHRSSISQNSVSSRRCSRPLRISTSCQRPSRYSGRNAERNQILQLATQTREIGVVVEAEAVMCSRRQEKMSVVRRRDLSMLCVFNVYYREYRRHSCPLKLSLPNILYSFL